MAASTVGPVSEDPSLRAPETETSAGTTRKEEAAPGIQGRRKTACHLRLIPLLPHFPPRPAVTYLHQGQAGRKGSGASQGWRGCRWAAGSRLQATALSPAHRCHRECEPLWLELPNLPVKPDTWILT